MRIVKLVVGALIVIGALYVLVGEQLGGTSANAMLNARLTTVRAQVAGDLSLNYRDLGALVAENETLGLVRDPLADSVHLEDLALELANTRADLEGLGDQTRANDAAIAALRERSRQFTNERIEQLRALITASRSRAGASDARLQKAEAALARSVQLQERGFETRAAGEAVRADQQIALLELEAAKDEVAALEIELKATRDGILLGDGANETPYSQQRIADLALQNDGLQARQTTLEARIRALQHRISVERARVDRLASSPVRSNVRGQLWQFIAADGEQVQRGQDLMRLIDCDSLIVTLSVSESIYNRLTVGAPAKFRPMGDDRVFPATVARLAGAGAGTIYQNLAVAPSERQLKGYDVTLTVSALNQHNDLGCAVGRTGRVFFDWRPLDRLRALS